MNSQFFDFGDFLRAIGSYPWWQVAIELLVIGTVVYWVVTFLQGTRGARLLKGIAFVLVALYVVVRLLADRYRLQRLDFLYGRFLVAAGFAIIVVFQPEIRRALMKLGEARWLPGSGGRHEDIDALVESATFLSRRKIGAVVAIERETNLSGMAEDATRLDADLTSELLNTIFWPNSPLHDLGVIVSNGRILYAGVQFPMAESGDLEKELGARHRAAVGMSQETDAIVLVVSEETGDISIAERGQLIRKLTPETLRGLLGELLGRGEARPFRRAA